MRHTHTFTGFGVRVQWKGEDPYMAVKDGWFPFMSHLRSEALQFAKEIRADYSEAEGTKRSAARIAVVPAVASFTFENKPTRKNRKHV